MEFIKTWLIGYYNPNKVIERLKDKPAPQWGFYASLLRAGFDSLLIYLPLAILDRQPSAASVLKFLATKDYYWASVFLMPVYLIFLWLLLAALAHLVLSLLHRESSINQILNITGMTDLIIGAALVPVDWLFISMDWKFPMILGFIHMLVVVWGIVITVIGFKKILNIPTWLGIILNIIMIIIGWALSIIFIRPPV